MAHAFQTVTLNLGYGADSPVTRGSMIVNRVDRGDNGSLLVTQGSQSVPMTSPPPTVDLEQGIIYRFVENWSGGKVRFCQISTDATADYSDLTDVVPAPDDGTGILGDEIISTAVDAEDSDTRTSLNAWGDAKYEAQADLDTDVTGLGYAKTSAVVPLSTVTTKGDLLAATGSGAVSRLGVGANGARLVADSTQAAGVRWSNTLEFSGSGMPNGVVAAPVGARYIDTSATNGAVEWIKTSGTGNTGWVVTYGDTGWRDISSLIGQGWTGNAYIKRVNKAVDLVILNLNGIAATNANIVQSGITVGFQAGANHPALGVIVSNGAAPGPQYGIGFVGGTANTILRAESGYATWATGLATGRIMYTTADLWPTSVPGTAA